MRQKFFFLWRQIYLNRKRIYANKISAIKMINRMSGGQSELNANAGLTTGDQQEYTIDELAYQQLHSKPLLLSQDSLRKLPLHEMM